MYRDPWRRGKSGTGNAGIFKPLERLLCEILLVDSEGSYESSASKDRGIFKKFESLVLDEDIGQARLVKDEEELNLDIRGFSNFNDETVTTPRRKRELIFKEDGQEYGQVLEMDGKIL